MSPTPEPPQGLYLDSCRTRYLATQERRTGRWSIQKQTGERGRPTAPFECPDFPASVNAGIFTYAPETT